MWDITQCCKNKVQMVIMVCPLRNVYNKIITHEHIVFDLSLDVASSIFGKDGILTF